MKPLIAAILLVLASVVPATAAPPTTTLESQAWYVQAGQTALVVPSDVGAHIHLRATVPADGFPIDGKVDVPLTITEHGNAGAVTSVRVSDGSTVRQTWQVSLGPCPVTCSLSMTVTVDFSKWPTGRREMRWTANEPNDGSGHRAYNSTGWQVCVRSCTPSYRSGPYTESRGWWNNRGYANARLSSALSTVRSGGTIKVSLKPGSGGLPTRFAGVFIDPAFHDGSAGIVVRQWSGPFTGSVTLPSLPAGAHTLVLLSSDGLNAGVLAIPFVVAP